MISNLRRGDFQNRPPNKTSMLSPKQAFFKIVMGVLFVAALSGCACRPGYVGPYGGVHPGRCFVG